MRAALTLWVLAGLFLVPAVGAQSGAGQTEARITDARGDANLHVLTQDNVSRSPAGSHVDILGAWLNNETDTTFEAGIALAQWQDPFEGDYSTSSRDFGVFFQYGPRLYAAVFRSGGTFGCSSAQASLGEAGMFGRETIVSVDHIACVNVTVEAPAGIARFEIPKQAISDHGKIPVVPGERLHGVSALAFYSLGFFVRTEDRAPDTGVGPDLLLRKGGGQASGHLLLSSPMPARASNGESTTMVFPLDIRNDDARDDVVHLRVQHAYTDWTIRLPERVTVPAREVTRVPLILSMNFTHLHGTQQDVLVRAESANHPGVFSELKLSVHWLDVPQPAGHHDRLWFHSRPVPSPATINLVAERRVVWMNALEKDPDPNTTDDAVPADPDGILWGGPQWQIPLDPGLAIGLDFDLAREAQLTTRIETTTPSTQSTLVAQIILCRKPETNRLSSSTSCEAPHRVILAEGKTGPRSVAATTTTQWEVALKPGPTADLLPYQPGSNLFLRLAIQQEAPSVVFPNYRPPTPKLIVKDSQLILPLIEYHDPVDQAFQDVGSLQVKVLGPHEKNVNPGRAAVFKIQVTNGAAAEQDVVFSIDGINKEWASLPQPGPLSLAPGASVEVPVVLQPPEDAVAGERAELFFVAQAKRDSAVVALARLRASVLDPTMSSIPNEEVPQIDAGPVDRTPGPGAWAAVLALGICVWLRRRA